MSSPYAYADAQIDKLKKYISAEFQNEMNALPFDELNVAKVQEQGKALFNRLKARNRVVFKRVAKSAYQEAITEARRAGFEADSDTDGVETALIVALFARYHPVSEYVYNNELLRKRDRLCEAVSSASNRQAVRGAFERTARLWFNQSRQYVDFTVDEARLQAFSDAGVREVIWVAELDAKTCSECKERDGTIYPIDRVPNKPHRGCRCHLRAVVRK